MNHDTRFIYSLEVSSQGLAQRDISTRRDVPAVIMEHPAGGMTGKEGRKMASLSLCMYRMYSVVDVLDTQWWKRSKGGGRRIGGGSRNASFIASFIRTRAASATNLRQCKKGIVDIFHVHETRQFAGRRRHLPLLHRAETIFKFGSQSGRAVWRCSEKIASKY